MLLNDDVMSVMSCYRTAAAASYDPANTAAATAAANATASSGARVLWLCRVLVVTDGLRVAEVGVAEAPASHSVVPRLIATSHVVVSELFHGLEGVKTSSVDCCTQNYYVGLRPLVRYPNDAFVKAYQTLVCMRYC
jgi:hypothetical protein